MLDRNVMNITMICDDAYVMPTMVCIRSITNSKNSATEVNIIVCTFSISKENQKKLEDLSTQGVTVSVLSLPMDKYKERLEKINQKSHVTLAALIKFELPNIFESLDKILYLDSDIIVKKDLFGLYNINLDNSYLAACFEFWRYVNNLIYVPKSKWDNSFYFNSGVMLLNLKEMRNNNITEKLWNDKLNRVNGSTLMDQDCFNYVCGSNVLQLPIKWNFNPEFHGVEYVEHINNFFSERYVGISDLLDDVGIIHYVGKHDKPWKYKTARLGNYWFETYDLLETLPPLEFQTETVKSKKQTTLAKLTGIKNKYGLLGTLCFIRYRFCLKIKKIVRGVTR